MTNKNGNKAPAAVEATRIVKSPFPRAALSKVLVIAQAIQDKNGGMPMDRLILADAIGRKPLSTAYRDLLSYSIKYGLTTGSEKAEMVVLTPLGERITAPSSPEDEAAAKMEAAMAPSLFKEIFNHYKGKKFPDHEKYFLNTLTSQFKVPKEYTEILSSILRENGQFSGILRNISGSLMVMFKPVVGSSSSKLASEDVPEADSLVDDSHIEELIEPEIPQAKVDEASQKDVRLKQVFLTHGANQDFLASIKRFLAFGEMIPIVSVEKATVSKGVPEKVMADMRSCGAAIIHVDAEEIIVDEKGKEHTILNGNVLIEIGAAMALYGHRFILLVKDGIKLPSNLQGLFEVRYKGDSLSAEDALKLLEAINDLKTQPLP